MLKEVEKLLEKTRRATTTYSNKQHYPTCLAKNFVTVEEALAAIESLDIGECELNVVIAPPDVTAVSDEESMNEDDMTGSEAMLPNAAGEIEIHFTPVQNYDMPTTSVPKIKRCTKVK